ncbi:conjugal transfer protein [Photobacterium indicum]|uniref:conjugal transfer protein n=1 Tax=Photobacterium indicum TaxID=81447 RepID=UPI003D13D100
MMSHPVLASGGLDDATNAVAEIQVWFYGFLGVACLLYMGYQVGLALTNKQDWMEVGLAFCKVAVAGGSVMGAAWAWSIWGS